MILSSIMIKQIQSAPMKKSDLATSELLRKDPKIDDSNESDSDDDFQNVNNSKIKQGAIRSKKYRHQTLEQLSE